LPGQTIRGRVTSVPLDGALQGNVMVYDVPISVTGLENQPLLVGMTANVQIQVAQATNVPVVPAYALQEVSGGYQVLVPNSTDPQAEPVAVPVKVGLNDGTNAQILDGLKVGDKVLAMMTARTTNNNARNTNLLSQLLRGIRMPTGGR